MQTDAMQRRHRGPLAQEWEQVVPLDRCRKVGSRAARDHQGVQVWAVGQRVGGPDSEPAARSHLLGRADRDHRDERLAVGPLRAREDLVGACEVKDLDLVEQENADERAYLGVRHGSEDIEERDPAFRGYWVSGDCMTTGSVPGQVEPEARRVAYSTTMKVGLVLPQAPEDGDGASWSEIAHLARLAEDAGADSLWVCDHFLDRAPGREVGYHEPFTLLAALAAATSVIGLGTLVAATSFRSPGLLAKIAATLDSIARGRLILGLGCGWHEPEYRAFGYPFDHRVGRFEEVVSALRPLLDGERVSMAGTWNRLEDAVILPSPVRRIPIVIAAEGPRMMTLTARHADGWQTGWFGLPDEGFRAERARLLDACAAVGRTYARGDPGGSRGPRTGGLRGPAPPPRSRGDHGRTRGLDGRGRRPCTTGRAPRDPPDLRDGSGGDPALQGLTFKPRTQPAIDPGASDLRSSSSQARSSAALFAPSAALAEQKKSAAVPIPMAGAPPESNAILSAPEGSGATRRRCGGPTSDQVDPYCSARAPNAAFGSHGMSG